MITLVTATLHAARLGKKGYDYGDALTIAADRRTAEQMWLEVLESS